MLSLKAAHIARLRRGLAIYPSLQKELAGSLGMMQAEIRRAVSGRFLTPRSAIERIKEAVRPTPAIIAAADNTLARYKDLLVALNQSERSFEAVDAARTAALRAVDELGLVLEDADPSGDFRAWNALVPQAS